ncbi:MAG: hypothetical protein IJ849_01660 [Selenomonadaceae bacterium]|nr:hypothetical protein [Selenomonadaceae bacterium]
MKLKKIIAAALVAMSLPIATQANGHLWYDRNAHIGQLGKNEKLYIYPIIDLDGSYWVNHSDVKSNAFKANEYLATRFARRLKFKNVNSLGAQIGEKKEIRTDDYDKFLKPFPDEQARAEAIQAYYFTPVTREVRTEPHQSPATTVTVQMRSYTKETGGPNGDRTYNERKWTVQHTIPAVELCLYHMDIEHTLYNKKGEKILTYENNEHSYKYNANTYRRKMFESLIDEFKDDYGDIQKDYQETKKKPRENSPVRIGFKGIQVPSNVGNDEYLIKSVYFTMKNFALKHTKASINYGDADDKPPRYEVQGVINRYTLDREWVPPHASTYDAVVSSKERKWYDKDGNEHTMTTTQYESKITDHHGFWKYTATVQGTFNLVDAKSGKVVVSHSATETDDKCADAYRHLMKDFYVKVKKYLGK